MPDAALRDRDPWPTAARSAGQVDVLLVRLARLESLSRLRLGRAAARFLSLRGYDALGFGRVGDYARERLGFSGRELQSFAFVASRLDALPLVRSAFLRGEISWSRVRLLCSVALPVTESAWLERARGLTVADLVLAIRRDREIAFSDEVADSLDEESDSIDGEPRVRFSLCLSGPCGVPLASSARARPAHDGLAGSAPRSVVGLLPATVSGLAAPSEPFWKGFERILLHVIGQWEAQPRHRDPVFARDGWRCAVPGCMGRRSLHDHHIEWRSRGGGNEQENRVTSCALCRARHKARRITCTESTEARSGRVGRRRTTFSGSSAFRRAGPRSSCFMGSGI